MKLKKLERIYKVASPKTVLDYTLSCSEEILDIVIVTSRKDGDIYLSYSDMNMEKLVGMVEFAKLCRVMSRDEDVWEEPEEPA